MGELHPKEATPRRKFDSDFKSDAVKLVEIGNRSIKQVANELGIPEATLNNRVYNVRRAKKASGETTPNLIEERARISNSLRHQRGGKNRDLRLDPMVQPEEETFKYW